MATNAGPIEYLSTVFPIPPKLTDNGDFTTGQDPGHSGGAVLYINLYEHNERRIALGGAHRGVKARPYIVELLCFFRWQGRYSQDAGAQNDVFLDGLTGWIEADRTADSGGVIFQWGEGDFHQPPDIKVRSYMPKTMRQQLTQVFTTVEVLTLELLQT